MSKRSDINDMICALVEGRRHSHGLCRWNHDIDYRNGWLYIDGENVGRVDRSIVQRAHELYARGGRPYVFSRGMGGSGRINIRMPDEDDWAPRGGKVTMASLRSLAAKGKRWTAKQMYVLPDSPRRKRGGKRRRC